MATRVILVDDHEIVRKGLSTLLRARDDIDIVSEAGDGLTAIKQVEKYDPDMVILDIEMPGLDGIVTAKQMISLKPTIQILALSMHKEQDYVTAMFTTGAMGYILKESAFDELLEAIDTVRQGKRYLSSNLVDVVLTSLSGEMPSSYESRLSVLTPRETEVLKNIAEGLVTKEIAAEMNVSPKTVDAHRQQIMKKLEIHSIAGLTRFAIREGLTNP